jgi:hypothetical protein
MGSRGDESRSLDRGARVTAGNERKVRGFPPLAAVRVRVAAGLTKELKWCTPRESLSGEIERETDREELSSKVAGSAAVSLLSRGRDLAAEALVGCSNLDLDDSARDEGRGRSPPRARKGGME